MKEFFKNFKYFGKYAKEQKIKIILYFIISIIFAITGIILPIVSANIIVKLTNNDLQQFILLGILFLIIEIFTDYILSIELILNQKIFREIYINIQYDLGKEILKINNKYLEENGSGMFIQRITSDTRNISTIFTNISVYTRGILSNIGVLVTYFILSKPMFIFIIIFLILTYLFEKKRINTKIKNDRQLRRKNDNLTGFTSEIVRGAKDIKILNGEKSFLQELKVKFTEINKQEYEMRKINELYSLISRNLYNISHMIMMIIIALSIKNDSISLATGVILYNFGTRYIGLITNITNLSELIKDFNLSSERIFDIFEEKKFPKDKFGIKHLNKINGDFEFKNVSFKYDKNLVLQNLNFKVKANETVAFVGKSGAGKTTIFNLLCKLYDDYQGEIFIDQENLKNLDKETIRNNITIVSQNPYIFNMSIKDNLKIIKKDLTEKEMKEACKMACLDEFIESLPNKYDTIIGEGGVNLSGGQKQRLAIARAFVQKTEIILFDEATSALDNETQNKIQHAIDNLQKDYTILIIAHRLSTIKNANRILMLDKGKIIAEGTHEKLLKTCIEYKNLYENEITKIDKKIR